MLSFKRALSFALLNVLIVLGSVGIATAAQSTSPHYQVNEAFFGTGGELNACSNAYCAKQSAGELTVGRTGSTNYLAQAGFNTDREPSLTFVVNSTSTNLGSMTSGTTKTATSSFSVASYLSDGYVVINASDPPRNGSHTMAAPSSPTASNSTTEQFGINLVANTSPWALGADPAQVPSGSFSFGAAASGYDTPDLYKYVKGDTVAESSKSTGQTDYTISYIFNISSVTPGGTYSMDHVLVATSTF
jgi:hypothetical protein